MLSDAPGAPARVLTAARTHRGLVTLCVTVTTSYGVLFYAFPVLSPAIAADTGWTLTTVTALFSASQVVAGLATARANRRPLGRDVHWWFVRAGLDAAPLRRVWERGPALVNDDGRYRAAFASGGPDRRKMLVRLEGDKVIWADGTVERVDTLLLATGYRPALDHLTPTGALDERGRPPHGGGVSTTVPGLDHVGPEFQRSLSSATLRRVGRDARRVLRRILA